MAIIKFGVLVTGVRGQVGGGIFSANKSGPFLKSWQYPIVPPTPEELLQRARLAELPTFWRDQTQTFRDDWDTAAASGSYDRVNSLGQTYQLSGYQLFVSFKRIQQTMTGSITATTPSVGVPTPPPDVAGSASEATQDIQLDLTAGDYTGSYRAYIEAQPIRSVALVSLPGRWKFMKAQAKATPTSISIAAEYIPKFGPLVEGQAFAIRLRRAHLSGVISTALTATATVAA